MENLEVQLECQICLSLICEPVTIPCGHTFCRGCLVHSLRKSKKQCVTCRSICNIDPVEASENIMLKNIAQIVNPSLYETRSAELALEKSTWSTIFPVFFYNVILFPGEILSLHLFEPRYKMMMQRIASTSRKFAYVYVPPNRPLIGSVALIAQVREAEFFADGRCLVEAIILFPRYTINEAYEESGTQGLYLAHLNPLNDFPFLDSQSSNSTLAPGDQGDGIDGESKVANPNQNEGLPSSSQIKLEISQKLSICREFCDRLQNVYQMKPYDPLPANPSLESDNKTFSNAVEYLTLAIMGRCPAGNKAQFLSSQNTIERLENCLLFLNAASEAHEIGGLGGLLRQSVGGLLNWIVRGGATGDDDAAADNNLDHESDDDDQDSTNES